MIKIGIDCRSDQRGNTFRNDDDADIIMVHGFVQGSLSRIGIANDDSIGSSKTETQNRIFIPNYEKFHGIFTGLYLTKNHNSDDQAVNSNAFGEADKNKSTAN